MKMLRLIRSIFIVFSFTLLIFSCSKDKSIGDAPAQLPRPVAFTANVNGTDVTFSWVAVAGASYSLELSKDSLLFVSDLQVFQLVGNSEYQIKGLSKNSRYSARIKTVSNNSTIKDSDYKAITFITEVTLESPAYYVATTGSDSNPGTKASPFKTMLKALSLAVPGDMIYLRGGTYYKELNSWKAVHINEISGTSEHRITISAYPGEVPVYDFCTVNPSNTQYGLIIENSRYLTIKGLEFKNIPMVAGSTANSYGVYLQNSSYITLEQVVSHDNEGVGICIQGNSTFNTVSNCDCYNNYDILAGGEDADGIEIGNMSSTCVNYVQGCRMWNNSDDGLDLWQNDGTMYVTGNWAWHNGYDKGGTTATGNGNGFKLGKTTITTTNVLRYLNNNVAFNNRKSGFDQNSAFCDMHIYNNTAYNNLLSQYSFAYSPTQVLSVRNNIALVTNSGGKKYLGVGVVDDHNTWNSGYSVSPSDFISIDPAGVDGPRRSDGSLPLLSFLKLNATSALNRAALDMNCGINIGAY